MTCKIVWFSSGLITRLTTRYCLVRSEIGGNKRVMASEAPTLSTRWPSCGPRRSLRSLLRSLRQPPSLRARPLPVPPDSGFLASYRLTKHDRSYRTSILWLEFLVFYLRVSLLMVSSLSSPLKRAPIQHSDIFSWKDSMSSLVIAPPLIANMR